MKKRDLTPWLLLPGIMLALSSVSVLIPHQTVQAATPTSPEKPTASITLASTPPASYDDGDGNELLEHWGDAKYSREEQMQMAGMAGGFILLGLVRLKRCAQKKSRCEIVPMPSESDFLKLDSRKAA